MKKALHTVRVPPITRVHNLYRLRFTVNEIRKIDPPTSVAFSESLTEYELSKYSRLKPRDRQGRRSRDHLAVCTYLGLLNRRSIQNEFHYSPTPLGEKLSRFEFRNECPKDIIESAVFTTALLKLRYTNAHYDHPEFNHLRYRPIVLILYALDLFPMRIEQLYFLLGSIRHEVELATPKGKRLFQFLLDPAFRSSDGGNVFAKKAGLSEEDVKELDRSIKPLLTWCEQVGLVLDDEHGAYHITDRGREVLRFAQSHHPIWFEDLGAHPEKKAALLLLLIAAKAKKKRFSQKFMNGILQASDELHLDHTTNGELIHWLSKKFGSRSAFLNAGNENSKFDFDFYSDIPPTSQDQVKEYFIQGIDELELDCTLESVSSMFFESLLSVLRNRSEEIELTRRSELQNIVMPRKEIFRVSFEYDSCIALRLLRFNAIKYQRQFEEMVSPSLKNTAEHNPDILVTNAIAYLVECKSKNEWHENVSFTKEVRREIVNYQDYCEGVNSNCALFLVESEFNKKDFYIQLEDTLKHKNKIVFCSYSFLLLCAKDEHTLRRFKKICDEPQSFHAREKILMNTFIASAKLL